MANGEIKFDNQVFAGNLRRLMSQANEKQVDIANLLKTSKSTVSAYCAGTQMPRMDKIELLALHFGVTKSALLEAAQPVKTVPTNGYAASLFPRVPILGTIPAGIPALASQEVLGYQPADVGDPEECFWLVVSGDSMINSGILPGDLVLIRFQSYADDGQIVACRVNGDEATLKRFHRRGDSIILSPDNPKYTPYVVDVAAFERGEAGIIGIAIQFMRKL